MSLIEHPSSPVLSRLRHPEHELLVALEDYEGEAFGPAGLRTYDLAVMAEAGAVYVASIGDEIVGGCQLMRMFDEPDFCYVVGFYVRPAWRESGTGRWLLGAVARECRELGARGLLLTVAPNNVKALNLYQSVGFEEEAFIPHFYGDGEDRFVLRWRFAKGDLSGSV